MGHMFSLLMSRRPSSSGSLLDKDVQLHKSSLAWRPSDKEVTSSQVSKEKKTEELVWSFRSILNKLTLENFYWLMVQVNKLKINTMVRIRHVALLVHEKAISGPSFSVMYRSMCRNMANLKDPSKPSKLRSSFKSILLRFWLGQIDKDQEKVDSFAIKQKEMEAAPAGEQEILRQELAETKAKARRCSLVKERKTSTRIRFMMHDVMDLRLNVWVQRKANLGPKTITQIHEEAEREEEMEQQKVSLPLFKELKKEDESPISLRPQSPWFFSPAPIKREKQPELPRISFLALPEHSGLGEEIPEFPLSQIPSSSQSNESQENIQDPEDKNLEVLPAKSVQRRDSHDFLLIKVMPPCLPKQAGLPKYPIILETNVWVPQRANLGPKTITQIHEEAKMEEEIEQQKVSLPLFKELKKEDESPISLRPQSPWFFSQAPIKREKQLELPRISSLSGLGEEIPELPLSQIPASASSQSEESVENLQKPDDRNPEGLLQNVKAMHIDTEEQLNCVVEMVYKKAISEPSSSGSYASMCRSLATLRVPMKNKPYIDVGFKSLLLQFCWKQIEKDQDVRCLVNSIKFFIELFKQKLLTEAIMQECVVKLLKQQEGKTLECLCHLLTSVGKEMDVGEAKSRMDAHFTQLKNLLKEQKRGSKRIRNMMKDVLVLRMNDWVPQETKEQKIL